MKNLLFCALASCAFVSTAMAAEPDWVSGIFYAGASKAARAEVDQASGPETTLVFTGEKGVKDSPFVQHPMHAASKNSALKFSLNPCDGAPLKVECWGEGAKGWCFQGVVSLDKSGWQTFELPLKEVESDQLKYLRFVLVPDGKTSKASLKVKGVEFANPFSVEESDGLEAKMPFPKVWDDSDGKRSASIAAVRIAANEGKGALLRLDYDFPRNECTQLEVEYPDLNMKAKGKALSFVCIGDGSANVLEIWATSPSGANVMLVSQPLSSKEALSVDGVDIPDDVAVIKNLKMILVKKQPGASSFILDSIFIK